MVPFWLPLIFLAGFAVLAFFGLRLTLNQQTETSLAAYQDIVQMPERHRAHHHHAALMRRTPRSHAPLWTIGKT